MASNFAGAALSQARNHPVRPFVCQVDVGVSDRRYCADTLRGDERELQRNPRGGRQGRTVEIRPKRLELRCATAPLTLAS